MSKQRKWIGIQSNEWDSTNQMGLFRRFLIAEIWDIFYEIWQKLFKNIVFNLQDYQVGSQKTVHFCSKRPEICIQIEFGVRARNQVWSKIHFAILTVHFHPSRPPCFHTAFSIIHFFDFRTVHFKSFEPSSLMNDRQVSVVWTVQFNPHGPFTLTQHRSLWPWPLSSGRVEGMPLWISGPFVLADPLNRFNCLVFLKDHPFLH